MTRRSYYKNKNFNKGEQEIANSTNHEQLNHTISKTKKITGYQSVQARKGAYNCESIDQKLFNNESSRSSQDKESNYQSNISSLKTII